MTSVAKPVWNVSQVCFSDNPLTKNISFTVTVKFDEVSILPGGPRLMGTTSQKQVFSIPLSLNVLLPVEKLMDIWLTFF